MIERTSAILLLSGGLDSTIAAYLARERYDFALALTFDYGQHACQREIEAAAALAFELNCPHEVISLSFLKTSLVSSLTEPLSSSELLPVPDDLDNIDLCKDSARSVWVPNRNGLFLNIAATIAEHRKIDWLICGFNREEALTFPDNSKPFIDMANLFFHYSTANGVRVLSPTIDMDKTEMIALARERGFSLEHFWSCYRGKSPLMCGRCESCARAIRAFKQANVWELYRHRFL